MTARESELTALVLTLAEKLAECSLKLTRVLNGETMIEPCYRLFGAKVEQVRNVLGWTQNELAKKVGLTRTSITNIEAGRQRILMHDVEKFAMAFQTTPKALLRGIWT